MTDDNYVRLRNDVLRAVTYLLHEQGTPIAGVPGMKMTKTGYVNEVLINDLAKRGHWPLKDVTES
jgi:hypothetical protein